MKIQLIELLALATIFFVVGGIHLTTLNGYYVISEPLILQQIVRGIVGLFCIGGGTILVYVWFRDHKQP